MCKQGGEIACCIQETTRWVSLGESVGSGGQCQVRRLGRESRGNRSECKRGAMYKEEQGGGTQRAPDLETVAPFPPWPGKEAVPEPRSWGEPCLQEGRSQQPVTRENKHPSCIFRMHSLWSPARPATGPVQPEGRKQKSHVMESVVISLQGAEKGAGGESVDLQR